MLFMLIRILFCLLLIQGAGEGSTIHESFTREIPTTGFNDFASYLVGVSCLVSMMGLDWREMVWGWRWREWLERVDVDMVSSNTGETALFYNQKHNDAYYIILSIWSFIHQN